MAEGVRISVEARSGEARCPYCHQELPADEREVCGGCATPYHAECLRELGRCALPGCLAPVVPRRGGRRERQRRRRARQAVARATGRPREHGGPGEQSLEPIPVSCAVYSVVWAVYLLVAALVFPAYLSSDLPTMLRALVFYQGMKWIGLGLAALFPLILWLMWWEARRGSR